MAKATLAPYSTFQQASSTTRGCSLTRWFVGPSRFEELDIVLQGVRHVTDPGSPMLSTANLLGNALGEVF